MRLVEDNPVQMGMRLQNADQQRAVSAASIDNRAERGAIVGSRHRHRRASHEISHGRVEGCVLFPTPRRVFERIVESALANHRISRAHTGFELLPSVLHPRVGDGHEHCARISSHAILYACAEHGEREGAVLLFLEAPSTRQKPHHAIERRRVHHNGFGAVLGRPGAIVEQIGDSQFRGKTKRLREVVPSRQVVESGLRREFRLRVFR
jgi:hypothetical protein